jgi:hypothetical protein
VPEVYDFCAHALEDATHDVDGGVVPVEEAGGGDEAHPVEGTIGSFHALTVVSAKVVNRRERWKTGMGWVVWT